MTAKQTVLDIDVRGKRVFVRVDFNVPMNRTTGITDDARIRAAIPTIQYLLAHDAAVILASHLGRPKGKVVEEARLAPVAQRLAELLGRPVEIATDSIGPEMERMAADLQPGQVLLLENLRFHPEEEKDDPEFARRLASLADIYVNDAFGSAHRAHASTHGVANYLPAIAGLLMEQELAALGVAFPDVQWAVETISADARQNTFIVRTTMSGSHHAEFRGLRPAGREFTLH